MSPAPAERDTPAEIEPRNADAGYRPVQEKQAVERQVDAAEVAPAEPLLPQPKQGDLLSSPSVAAPAAPIITPPAPAAAEAAVVPGDTPQH
jgi:hypothetical protein